MRRRWYFLIALAFLAIFVWYVVWCEDRHGILTVAFLDVGQGDAILIEAPNGNQVLIDGGSNRSVLRSLGAVMPFYDRTVDLVLMSHPHIDHYGGLLSVLPRYKVGGFASSGTLVRDQEFGELEQAVGDPAIILHQGMVIDLGGGAIIDVLLPDRDVSRTDPHDGMLVMRLSYGKSSILLVGDMENNLENYLISLYGDRLKSQVLKVGHHGSKNSTGHTFLGYVSPEYAVISVGADNSFGHPNEKTLAELESFKAKILRTDIEGTVILKSDGVAFRP